MGYTVKVFDTRYDWEHAWSTIDEPSDLACVSVATWNGTMIAPPRVFAADGGSDGNHSNVVQLEVPATYSDAPTSGSSAVAITATWISKQFNMGFPGRDKRVHLWGFKVRNPAAATGASNITTSVYTSGSPTATTATAAQVQSTTLSPTSVGNDWGVAPQAGNNVTVIRTEGVNALRSELFQLVITTADTSMSDFRLCEADLYYTMAG